MGFRTSDFLGVLGSRVPGEEFIELALRVSGF